MKAILFLVVYLTLQTFLKVDAETCRNNKTCPRNCLEVYPSKPDLHLIQLDNYGPNPFWVACDQHHDGGGWTIIQRRIDGNVDFYRGWRDYKFGFGDLTGEFWIGLEKLHAITTAAKHELLVELKDFNNNTKIAKYDLFGIGDENEGYALKVLGAYTGTAGDSLSFHKAHKFSAKDNDNGLVRRNCSIEHFGAWWYGESYCFQSNLNGRYLKGNKDWSGVIWNGFQRQTSLQFTQMMIRPKMEFNIKQLFFKGKST